MSDHLPESGPREHGMLDVGDGQLVYWESCGDPAGRPALVVHGGPGSGCSVSARSAIDPGRHRVVLFDQRGCGRSRPHVSDPGTDLTSNTTRHLIDDMERLREHLRIERWLLFGGSWGSTLILAYAEQHPQRVSEIVITGVTTSSRAEIDWLYRGARRFFPEQWERFRSSALGNERDGDVIAAYARLLADPDPAVRVKAAADWCAWEDAVLSWETKGAPGPYTGRPQQAQLALARLCAHYFSHDAWLEDGVLLREADRLAGIPGVLIHGRRDMGAPLDTAWELSRRWPTAELIVVDEAGHLGTAATREHVRHALERFAA